MLLVVLEHDRGVLAEAGREALTFGRALAAKMEAQMHAAVIGAAAVADASAAIAADAGAYGAVAVHTADHEVLSDFGPEAWGETIAQMVAILKPRAVLACGSERGNEVMAQAAARLDVPFTANCVDVSSADTDESSGDALWTITRVQWGGSLLEDVTLLTGTPLVTCALHTVASSPVDTPAAPDMSSVTVDLPVELSRTVVKDRVVLTAGVTLPTAQVVVGGGRGVGSAEGFAILEELAELVGGVVGCSRAVTNNGWRPHSDQVGQTGTRIAPEIYIASGISGAIQHWVGAVGSKHILAVNTDPEANMVAKANWAVICDLHLLIPAVSEEIRRRRD